MITKQEREVMVRALEAIERQPDEVRKVAALRTFARCVRGLHPDPDDVAVLQLPKHLRFMARRDDKKESTHDA